jgi:hypothetical protein
MNSPVVVHGGEGLVFEVVALDTLSALRWLRIVPGRPPQDLGPLPVTGIPAPFSDDGRRGVVVEPESQYDVWLLQWPGQDSTGAGGAR